MPTNPTQNQCCCTKCPRDCPICNACHQPANSMQKPQNPMQENWEKELEERFMAFHFEFDERQEHDRSTAELRDWTKSFIRQLLTSQKDQLTKEMADAIEMSKQGWIEQRKEAQKDQIRETLKLWRPVFYRDRVCDNDLQALDDLLKEF